MLNPDEIQAVVRRIVAASHPSRVILFGSYARGDADEGSDLDLMVIKRDVADKGKEMLEASCAAGAVPGGVDVLVYSEREFERRGSVPGTLIYQVRQEGKVVYDARP